MFDLHLTFKEQIAENISLLEATPVIIDETGGAHITVFELLDYVSSHTKDMWAVTIPEFFTDPIAYTSSKKKDENDYPKIIKLGKMHDMVLNLEVDKIMVKVTAFADESQFYEFEVTTKDIDYHVYRDFHRKYMEYSYMFVGTEWLTGLAEECSELAQAALKLRRCTGLDGQRVLPTSTKRNEAYDNLYEELADVLLTAESYGIDLLNNGSTDMKKIRAWMAYKRNRFIDRCESRGITTRTMTSTNDVN